MIIKLANSFPVEESLRKTFLSAPAVRKILGDRVDDGPAQVDSGLNRTGNDQNQKPDP